MLFRSKATACSRVAIGDGFKANALAEAAEQSLKLFGIKSLRQVADVETNAHDREGVRLKRTLQAVESRQCRMKLITPHATLRQPLAGAGQHLLVMVCGRCGRGQASEGSLTGQVVEKLPKRWPGCEVERLLQPLAIERRPRMKQRIQGVAPTPQGLLGEIGRAHV